MAELEEALARIEEKIGDLLVEFKEVKHLLQEKEAEKQFTISKKKPLIGEGYDNIVRLYEEGYHICHSHFGCKRDVNEGECLFCITLLQK